MGLKRRQPLNTCHYEDFLDKPALNAPEMEVARREKASTVTYAMSILRLLAEREHALGVNAIARELSLAPSTCFKILKSLVAEEFVEIDPFTKGYSLGTAAIIVARRALDPARAFTTIRGRVDEMAQAYSIAIGMWRMIPRSRMVLAGFAEGTNQMRIHMSVGKRLPVLIGAVGRAVAADMELSQKELENGFRALHWQVPISFESYAEEVQLAKVRGYGYDEGNFSPGVNTVGVTILDELSVIRYGLSAVMFKGQHSAETVEQIGRDLIALKAWASARLFSKAMYRVAVA